MKQKQNKKMNLSLLIVIVIAIVFGWIIYSRGMTYKPKEDSSTIRKDTYKSQLLQFSVSVPKGFSTEDTGIHVVLLGNKGQIEIVRNGTNFDNITGYLEDFDSKRAPIQILNSQETIIRGYPVLNREEIFPNIDLKQRAYYIYVPNTVYIISTDSQGLYDDLDQVAQSFRHEP